MIKRERASIVFLQTVIVLLGVTALVFLIRFPLTEGRAANLDLFSIYSDKFILYGYATSIAFFVALYNAFKLLGYIGRHKLFSPKALKALKNIKRCAIVLSILIVAAGLFIKLYHNKEDDPAGFLATCIVTAFVSVVVAVIATKVEKKVYKAQ